MRNERGLANTVQAVLVMPALFGILLLVLQWGMWVWAGATAQAAAHDGARAAAVLDGSTTAGRRAADEALASGAIREATVQVQRGSRRTVVTVTGHPVALLPSMGSVSRTVDLPTERITRS